MQQAAGGQFAARGASCGLSDGAAELAMDLAAAYPTEAGLRTWRRSVRLERGAAPGVVVRDAFELDRPATVALSLVLAVEPIVAGDGCRLGESALAWPADTFTVGVEAVAVDDGRLRPVWGERVWRLLLTTREPVSGGDWMVTIR